GICNFQGICRCQSTTDLWGHLRGDERDYQLRYVDVEGRGDGSSVPGTMNLSLCPNGFYHGGDFLSITKTAIVVGGGIGGLTTALKLHRAGVSVRVFESVENIRALGVGINLLPHAV